MLNVYLCFELMVQNYQQVYGLEFKGTQVDSYSSAPPLPTCIIVTKWFWQQNATLPIAVYQTYLCISIYTLYNLVVHSKSSNLRSSLIDVFRHTQIIIRLASPCFIPTTMKAICLIPTSYAWCSGCEGKTEWCWFILILFSPTVIYSWAPDHHYGKYDSQQVGWQGV